MNKRLSLILGSLLAIAVIVWVFRPDDYLLHPGDLNVKLSAVDSASEHQWVTIANRENIPNGNHEYKQGDTCSITLIGEFQVESRVKGIAFVMFTHPDNHQGYGAQCPNGTVFKLNESEVPSLFSTQRRFRAERKEEIALVEQLTSVSTAKPIRPQQPFGWITVANYPGVRNGNGYHEYRDSCSLFTTDGPFSVIGSRKNDGAQLVRYDGPQGFGAPCGTGTLFWAKPISN